MFSSPPNLSVHNTKLKLSHFYSCSLISHNGTRVLILIYSLKLLNNYKSSKDATCSYISVFWQFAKNKEVLPDLQYKFPYP